VTGVSRELIKKASLKKIRECVEEIFMDLVEERLEEGFFGKIILDVRIRDGFLRTISYEPTQIQHYQFEEQFRKSPERT
jgi:hypothetical protein